MTTELRDLIAETLAGHEAIELVGEHLANFETGMYVDRLGLIGRAA